MSVVSQMSLKLNWLSGGCSSLFNNNLAKNFLAMGYPAIVGSVRFCPYIFVQGGDDCVTEIVWEFSLFPAADE